MTIELFSIHACKTRISKLRVVRVPVQIEEQCVRFGHWHPHHHPGIWAVPHQAEGASHGHEVTPGVEAVAIS